MDKETQKEESQAHNRYLHVKKVVDSAGWSIFKSEYVDPVIASWGDIRSLEGKAPEEMAQEIQAKRNAIERLEEIISAFEEELTQYEDNTPDKKVEESYVERLD